MPGRRRAAAVVLGALLLAPPLAACTDDGGSAAELCRLAGDGSAYRDLFAEGFDPTDTAHALAQLKAAHADLTRLRAAAPSSVDDDLDRELAYIDAVTHVVETVNPDDQTAVVNAINALEQQRSAADVASLNLQRFQAERCTTTTSSPG